MDVKTIDGYNVEKLVIYEIEYNNGKSLGVGWINPKHCDGNYVDILCVDGGVTYQPINEVKFIKQY